MDTIQKSEAMKLPLTPTNDSSMIIDGIKFIEQRRDDTSVCIVEEVDQDLAAATDDSKLQEFCQMKRLEDLQEVDGVDTS